MHLHTVSDPKCDAHMHARKLRLYYDKGRAKLTVHAGFDFARTSVWGRIKTVKNIICIDMRTLYHQKVVALNQEGFFSAQFSSIHDQSIHHFINQSIWPDRHFQSFFLVQGDFFQRLHQEMTVFMKKVFTYDVLPCRYKKRHRHHRVYLCSQDASNDMPDDLWREIWD